jgi:hypothetical protein
VLDEIEAGTLTLDHVEVLRQFPHYFEDVRLKVNDELVDMDARGQRPDFPTRVQLGVLLGLPTDRALLPTQMAATALLFEQRAAGASQGPAPRRGSGKPSPLARGLETDLERIEMGEVPS